MRSIAGEPNKISYTCDDTTQPLGGSATTEATCNVDDGADPRWQFPSPPFLCLRTLSILYRYIVKACCVWLVISSVVFVGVLFWLACFFVVLLCLFC